ncbi:MAG: hypothetical protein CM15mP36_03470 [Flavobacteriales bacterium]|nr:MAG: hypothetical protein CM15mP36_03470 [Flavobacteriales bacterium]
MSLVILFKVLTVPILNDFVSMILFLEIRFNSVLPPPTSTYR